MTTATENRVVPGKPIMMRMECDLTEIEIVDYCRQTATLHTTYKAKEQEKKDTMALYTRELKQIRGSLDRLSEAATTGKEERDVRCRQTYLLDDGEVEIMRCDTGEIVKTRPMTPEEITRFDLREEDMTNEN